MAVLRALYLWSGRRYHRELLRRELRRIGLTLAAERQAQMNTTNDFGFSKEHGRKMEAGWRPVPRVAGGTGSPKDHGGEDFPPTLGAVGEAGTSFIGIKHRARLGRV